MSEPPLRKILHIDMDAFYASVEQLDNPKLRGRPVAVGGNPEGRGVVASASYEARRFGVRSAMSSRKAKRICPDLVFVYPRFSRYQEASRKIREIFARATPLVEPLSLDEAYLDVTHNLYDEPIAKKIAARIKAEIRAETGLTASAGVAPNKFLAKIASDLQKPDGLVVISPSKVLPFLETLPVEKLWGVGPVTAQKLKEFGLATAGQIRRTPALELERRFGKFGLFLHDLSLGIDHRPVETEWETKSRGSEETFERDVLDVKKLEECLRDQAQGLAEELKAADSLARTITVKLRYSDFKTITRSRTVTRPIARAELLARHAQELLIEKTDAGRVPVRLIGLSLSGFLKRDEPQQLWLEFMDEGGV